MVTAIAEEMKNMRAFSLVRFVPDRNLAIALGAAMLSVIISALMNLSESGIFRIILRQFLQVIGVGLVLPFFVLRHDGAFQDAAIRFDHPIRVWGLLKFY